MGGLRVIAGKAKGQNLRSVPGDSTRPITDRTKESLFNIIGADIIDSTVLDLFAGTGSVGIEALSRGAKLVLLVDRSQQAINTVKINLHKTGLDQNAKVLKQDAFKLLKQATSQAFDYIYIAPPQYKELWIRSLFLLDSNPEWLSCDAWTIAQIHPIEYQSIELEQLVEFDQRQYGSTLLLFYKMKETA
ncbi:16S rRNA (guanine(966)-N(2))-methyltransferase RsmD [Chloroflexota bacterium]